MTDRTPAAPESGTWDELAQFGSFWMNCDNCGELHPAEEFSVESDSLWHGDHAASDESDEEIDNVIKWLQAEQDYRYQEYRDEEDEPGYAYEDHR